MNDPTDPQACKFVVSLPNGDWQTVDVSEHEARANGRDGWSKLLGGKVIDAIETMRRRRETSDA